MPAVPCSSCGRRIELPDGYARGKIRCPGCGYYAEVPVELRSGTPSPVSAPLVTTPSPADQTTPEPDTDSDNEPTPFGAESYGFSEPLAPPPPSKPLPQPPRRIAKRRSDPRDHRPDFEPDAPAGDPLLHGTQDEDDDQPYAVPGTGLQKCKHCRGDLPLTAQLCVHCGRDLSTGEKVKKVYQPIYREWEEGLSLNSRIQILAGLQVVNFAIAVMSFIVQDLSLRDSSAIITNMLFGIIQLGLQAFLLGTYDTLQLNRNPKGQTTLTRIRRIAFYSLPPEKLDWKGSAIVGTMATHDPGLSSWMICLYLLMLGCLPGILFYWFVIRPERCTVNLANEYGSSEQVIFRTTDREFALSIAELVSECTKLQLRKIL